MKIQLLKQNIDYSKVVTGKHLDYETYNKKFEMWDYIVERNLVNTAEAKQLLRDDLTIFSYSRLCDTEQNLLRFTAYQDAIASCRHDFSDMGINRFVIFRAANQIGKSLKLAAFAIHKAFTETNINIIMVSKSLPQSQFLLATIRHTLNNSQFSETWRESLGETANTTILTFQREKGKIVNRIICAPCGEGLLGYPVHYLLLDEADFYENAKEFFYKVALPRTNKTKGQIIVFSNPNPSISKAESLLWRLWTGKMFRRKFKFNFLDAPWNTQEEYDQAKQDVPSYIFQSTHGGQFPQDQGSFFKQTELDRNLIKEWQNILPSAESAVYIGLDLGKVRDPSVITLGIRKEENNVLKVDVKYIEEFPLGTDYKDVVGRLKQLVDYYTTEYKGVGGIGFDATGVGKAVQEFLTEAGLMYTDITWSLQTKSKLYGDFKLLMENDRIKIVYTDKCYQQLAGLTFKKTERGYLSVAHGKESMHDDIPDSIAMLIAVSIKPMTVTPGFTVLGGGKTKVVDNFESGIDGDSSIFGRHRW